jgi:dephospho-CoA kinase
VLLIGLTGSIGMGKSTIARRFRALGIEVCDADALVHQLYSGVAVGPVGAAFSGVVVDGQIDRAALGQKLLADPSGFKRLEAIVHPLVRAAERDALVACATRGDKMAVLEIPLLFETGGDRLVDTTVVVSAPPLTQRERVLARSGMTEKKFEEILSRQMPDADKRKRAEFVVDTGGTLAESDAQVDKLVSILAVRVGRAYDRHWT